MVARTVAQPLAEFLSRPQQVAVLPLGKGALRLTLIRGGEVGEDAADSQRWELRQPRGQLGDIFGREAEAVHAAIHLDMYRVVAEPMRLGSAR